MSALEYKSGHNVVFIKNLIISIVRVPKISTDIYKQINYVQKFLKYFLIRSSFDFQLFGGNFLTYKN